LRCAAGQEPHPTDYLGHDGSVVRSAFREAMTAPHLPAAEAPPPEVDGREVLGLLGGGGFADVYLAYDPEFDRYVALTARRRPADQAGEDGLRLHGEGLVAAGRVNHPNVAPVYGAGLTRDGRPYMEMEHVAAWPPAPCRRRRPPASSRRWPAPA